MLLAMETPPSAADPLFWADFVELHALVHPDHCYSRGDLSTLLRRNRDTAINRTADEETRWRDIAIFAATRSSEFGAAYPYRVSDDGDTLELIADLTAENEAYLKLLLASLMRHAPRNRRAELGRFFEQACHLVFCKLMPTGSTVYPTWASGGEAAHYQGTLFEKMTKLASDIRCTANFKERDFKANDTGDGGIDIVAWHPMADVRDGMPMAFAQCGCSKEDWSFKHLEASPSKHFRHFPVMHRWATYYFMPLDLRHADGDWAYKSDIGEAIIVDRLRLLRLSTQYDLLDDFPELPLLDDIRALAAA
ncbi:hypothetical protein OTERR_13090 [Oryzomicrobium terrae]|uniref:Uncharacterized protein n=1 Tax=Oryzomicrobium terrae TaxID=1735038 RepID=A0A5C1E837_9RHOO|nr:hypothetical protein [Oryzomicrobium terrae]QEL64785.1 hypothetical protein OTERR_13090 [Oryzomicrobium terrae]